MALSRFSPQCCCTQCAIFDSDFTSANSTDVSPWIEVSGDWSINTNRMQVSSSNAVATLAISDTPDVRLLCTKPLASENDYFRLIVNYTDADNYYYGEFSGSHNCGGDSSKFATVQLWQRLAGVETAISPLSGCCSDVWCSLCLDGQRLVACWIDNDPVFGPLVSHVKASAQAVVAVGTSPIVGVGTSAATFAVKFDNVRIERVSENCLGCRTKCSSCGTDSEVSSGVAPLTAVVTLSGIAGDACCSSLNGTFVLDLVNGPLASTFCRWCYHFDDPLGGTCIEEYLVLIKHGTSLSLIIGGHDSCTNDSQYRTEFAASGFTENCFSWDEVSLPWLYDAIVDGNPIDCLGSSATCTVSSGDI